MDSTFSRLLRCAIAVLALVSMTASATAQNAEQFTTWTDTAKNLKPTAACESLRSMSRYDLAIDTVTVLPSSGNVPAFCQVIGLIQPEIRFEVSMPAAWNGRFYMFGNQGWAGESISVPERIRRRNAALQQGFAVAQTNTGHDAAREPLAAFVSNSQKAIDYGYRAVHVVALTAKELVRTYYATSPSKSYFDGCSNGGRQGLMSAQRFPDDFDGIVVGAPLMDLTGTMIQYAVLSQATERTALSADKVRTLADRVYKKCDALDGLADGLISNPLSCHVDPTKDVPACGEAADNASCLTPAEAKVVQTVYTDITSRGRRVYPALVPGSEVFTPTAFGGVPGSGWSRAIIASEDPAQPTMYKERGEDFLKLALVPANDLHSFDIDRDYDKVRPLSDIFDSLDPDLTRFRARGGKILFYWGWADTSINPVTGVNYYEQVKKTMGPETPDFFRLFMVPGMFHCGNGVGTDRADTITPLVDWVEHGKAPEQIRASRVLDGKVIRTRPWCPYPQIAKYRGTGSIDEAANFVCAAP